MAFALNYSVEELRVEPRGTIQPKRYPVAGAGKPLHIVWSGQHLWFTGSANCIGRRTQESGDIKLFQRRRGVCATRIAEWREPGANRLLYIDPEGGIVGSIGIDEQMVEHEFPGAKPRALMQDGIDVWIGCGSAPFLLRAEANAITPVPYQTPIDAVSRGPESCLWCFSADTLKAMDLERRTAHTWKLPATFHVRDLCIDSASAHAYYCDEDRDVIGRITALDTVVEYQLPKGTGPRRVRRGPKGALWFTGRQGRSLFYIDGRVVKEFPSAHSNSDLFDFDCGAGETLWFTEPDANCLASVSTIGL
ncbi:NHL repeat-containing protein [Lysobacter terrae]